MANEAPPRGAAPDGAASEPRSVALVAAALGLSAFVIAYPFTTVRYPPLTDLPFHAAILSVFRHYFDPSFHFREQFTWQPIAVPYVSMYLVGAIAAVPFSIPVAAKIMSAVMLALVPAGLAVMFHGMKKSPLLGLFGLGLVWCTDTQWGFLSFMGAVGLYAMSVGFALLLVDQPTRARSVGLCLSLFGVFFTHVFQFPFAVLAALAAGAFVYPNTRRFSPLIPAVLPAVALFAVWAAIRPRTMGIGLSTLGFHPERLAEIGKHLFGSYWPVDGAPMTPEGALERRIEIRMLVVAVFAVGALTLLFFTDGRASRRGEEGARWDKSVTAFSLVSAAGFLLCYVVLPFQSGPWFYIYPREIVLVVVALLGATPDLPNALAPRVAFVAAIGFLTVPMTKFVTNRFREFEHATADFRDVVRSMPKAPKLFYLMYWLGDSNKRISPFLHLPAWIQAEKGGALDFHFVVWNQSPIRYRNDPKSVPPPLPAGFEWTPQYFRLARQGGWFDTFLVRHRIDPHELFDSDPTIHLVLHRGTFWLYRRSGISTGPGN